MDGIGYGLLATGAMFLCGGIGELLLRLRTNRVGGLTFWRLGRIGGSFYIARKQEG